MRRNLLLSKFLVLSVFEIGYTSILPTALNFDIKLHSRPFFFKKHIFAFLTKKKKNEDWKTTFLKDR